jgi:hypothetical protein
LIHDLADALMREKQAHAGNKTIYQQDRQEDHTEIKACSARLLATCIYC